MTVDCKWVEKNLEALFCDRLNPEQDQLARRHIDSCVSCRNEVQALHAIDPLIKNYFRRELEIAGRPRAVNRIRAFGLGGAGLAVASILLLVVLRAPATRPVSHPVPVAPPPAATASVDLPPAPVKNDAVAEITERAKPSAQPDQTPAPTQKAAPAVSANAPEFAVTDPAGYSHTLEEYRGHVVVIGLWRPDQAGPATNLDRLYKTFGSNPKFRFLGVTNERKAKPVNLTFPVVYNQGSKVFGAQPGDFVLLDESGSVELRGSLVKDFESLRKALQGK